MVDGDPNVCSTWGDGRVFVRGETLEARPLGSQPPQFPTAAGPARLESGTAVVVLARMVEGRLERLRAIGDDCPIDAGGRTVYWLNGITPAESVRYLDGLTRSDALNISTNRRIAESALAAIALHRDPAATAVLDRLSGREGDRLLRRQAASALARTRGAHGFERVSALLKDESDRDMRQALVSALGESPQPAATDALLALAKADTNGTVRAEAAYRYVRRAGQAGLQAALALLNTDTDDNVKRRVVSAIALLPAPTSSPVLIELARTNPSLVVRKEAVSALGRSKDTGAVQFLEELVNR
jgi:HEAT repeat protein